MKIKETDLAKVLIESFDGTEYEIYQEVTTPNGSADVVLKYGFTWAIEVKLGMNLTLIAQARYNLRYFNYSSIVLPNKCCNGKTFDFGRELCKIYGIGIFLIREEKRNYDTRVHELIRAKLQRRAMTDSIKLCDYQKTFAEAGNPNGKRWSPFQQTVREFKYFVEHNPGCKLKEALTEIGHHYTSISSAQNSIRQWIRSGVIKGIVIDRGICNLEKTG